MINNSDLKVAKKYQHMIKEITVDYNIALEEGFQFAEGEAKAFFNTDRTEAGFRYKYALAQLVKLIVEVVEAPVKEEIDAVEAVEFLESEEIAPIVEALSEEVQKETEVKVEKGQFVVVTMDDNRELGGWVFDETEFSLTIVANGSMEPRSLNKRYISSIEIQTKKAIK